LTQGISLVCERLAGAFSQNEATEKIQVHCLVVRLISLFIYFFSFLSSIIANEYIAIAKKNRDVFTEGDVKK